MSTEVEAAAPLLGDHQLDRDGRQSDPAAEVATASGLGTSPHDSAETISSSRLHGNLYVSHFLSTWNSRVFEFGAVLYLAAIFPDTLLPLSVYALVRGLATVFIAPSIGQYIDTRSRLHVVRLSIVGQRIVVASSCAIFFTLSRGYVKAGWVQTLLLGAVTLFACIEKLCAVMNLVSVERDWVVVVAGGNEAVLRLLNSQMRRIDLICKLAGPLFIALISGFSMDGAIIFNFSMNVASVGYEYYAIAKVYRSVPELQLPKSPAGPVRNESDSQRGTLLRRIRGTISTTAADMRMYFLHSAFLPSFTCSLLYFTVLSFSGQMITYLLVVGYDARIIGFARVFSVGFELSATWLAPRVMERIGPVRSGLWFINWQILCLAVAVTVLRGTEVPLLAASALVIGTILSRLGLWGFDLSVQVIIQEEVEPERRGLFSSVEASWQSAFELCSYASTIVWSRPEQFQWPVLMSFGAVFSAGMLYAFFVRKRRGHLLHMSHCMEVPDTKDIREYERLLQERHSSYLPFGMPRLAELSHRI